MKRNTYHPLLIDTVTAAEDLPKNRFVGFDGSLAKANTRALGVTLYDFKTGESANAGVLGIYLATAGGAFAAGDLIGVGADGKAVKSTGVAIGVAREAATADGDIVPVILGASTSEAASASGS